MNIYRYEPGGFFNVRGKLGQELVVCHTHAGLQARVFQYVCLQRTPDLFATAEQAHAAGYIKERLVQRQPFHQGRDFPEQRKNLQ